MFPGVFLKSPGVSKKFPGVFLKFPDAPKKSPGGFLQFEIGGHFFIDSVSTLIAIRVRAAKKIYNSGRGCGMDG